jgi:catechol 2,3-dioxygenase-like lactoylglutathione lyase family enzyme
MRAVTRLRVAWRLRAAPLLALPALLAFGTSRAPAQTLARPAAHVAPAAASAAVRAVTAVGMTVSDVDRAVAFYTSVLAFERVSDVEVADSAYEHLSGVFPARARVVRLRLGGEMLELTEYLAPRGLPVPADSRSQDRWFQHVAIVVSDMDSAYARLRRFHVEHASSGPQRLPDWNPNAGGIRAFYFRDPDRHTLELIQFPPGKGDPRWQRADGRLFLGIDHTAIVARDTPASLAFYRDLLGMRLVGGSENYGPEQEHLNAVLGARLRITALRATAGPGVELLEYLTPRDGRPFPDDAHANDLLHWQTTLIVPDADAAARALRAAGTAFVSPGVVTLDDARLGFRRALLVRDPDGHALQLVERP